MALGVFEIGSY